MEQLDLGLEIPAVIAFPSKRKQIRTRARIGGNAIVCVFPIARRDALVRDVAASLVEAEGDEIRRNALWDARIATLAADISRFGLTDDQIIRQLLEFRSVVHAATWSSATRLGRGGGS